MITYDVLHAQSHSINDLQRLAKDVMPGLQQSRKSYRLASRDGTQKKLIRWTGLITCRY